MSLLPFTFAETNHLYQTPGHYVLSTSDVIDLNGLSDMSMIPIQQLRHACYRGKVLHKAIQRYEQGHDWQDDETAQFMNYMDGWFAFRDQHDIQIVGEHEKSYVYVHDGTEQAIGATIDLRFIYEGNLYIPDLKTVHPVGGEQGERPGYKYAAFKQKKLAWRLQTQSYLEATSLDSDFISDVLRDYEVRHIRRAVIHIHPNLKQGYAFHLFPEDDSLLWDSAVRLAMEKVKAGILPSRRGVSVQAALEASLAVEA